MTIIQFFLCLTEILKATILNFHEVNKVQLYHCKVAKYTQEKGGNNLQYAPIFLTEFIMFNHAWIQSKMGRDQ